MSLSLALSIARWIVRQGPGLRPVGINLELRGKGNGPGLAGTGVGPGVIAVGTGLGVITVGNGPGTISLAHVGFGTVCAASRKSTPVGETKRMPDDEFRAHVAVEPIVVPVALSTS